MNVKLISIAIIWLMVIGSCGVIGTHNVKNQSFEIFKFESDENINIGKYMPGEVVVGFYKEILDLDPINVKDINSFEEHNIIEKIEVLNVAVLEVDEGGEQEFIDDIIDSPFVEYAELNWIIYAAYTPNDPSWDSQWGPQRIHCEEAWDTQQGSSSVKIAILDTGVDYNHEDIASNYVSGGYDWINSDSDPMDDNDHGTHCAGIAAAVMDNNKGVAGVAQVSIMAEKVLNSGGTGTSTQVASGITHAADNGADIISMSLSSTSPSSAIEDACYYAYNTKDVVIVAAAGNNGKYGVNYPAHFDTVIAVGATDNTDQRCDFSNYGEGLELVAPGKRILSTIIGDNYDYLTGTSMATPHVAGVAALARSSYPDENNVWIRQKMVDTAEDLGSAGWDEDFGYGLVDARLSGEEPTLPKVSINVFKVKEIDDLDSILGGDPELYYKIKVDTSSYFEYNGYEEQFLFWWIFHWNSESIWIPNKTYSFEAKYYTVTVKIKLMEHDGILEGGFDDLADVSAYSGGGTDNSIEDVRGAIYTGKYNLITDELTGDQVGQDGSFFTTNGEDDGSTSSDENDAKIWFKISDNYEPSEPDLDARGSLSWANVPPGAKRTGEIFVENIGEYDPYGQNKLKWEITDWPEWGYWSFNPRSGTLKPEDGEKKITVTVIAPNQKQEQFTGRLKIKNTENPSDYEYIDIQLTTPKNKLPYNAMFLKILERFPKNFAILKFLLKL